MSTGPVSPLPLKAQALLAYLAIRPGQRHARDKLAALLWGDTGDAQARDSLRHTVTAIRRALDAAADRVPIAGGQSVALDPEGLDVDVIVFERRVAEATPEALDEAVALYQGDLLEGLAVSEARFEEWLLAERERLRELALEAFAKLLAHQSQAGVTERAIQTAVRLLALDPLQEAVHRALMRLYARQGRRGAALKQYQICVSVLQRELGAEPEADTKQLYQEILRERRTAEPARSVSLHISAERKSHAARAPAQAIPTLDAPLIGREMELARLREALEAACEGRGRIVTILGEAGIGKSSIVGALVTEADRCGSEVLFGRSYESEQVLPFGPWVDAFGTGHTVLDAEVLGTLEPIWRAELARLLPTIGVSGLPTPSNDLRRLFESVAHLVDQLSARRPLIVILEDVHWADEMTVRLAAFLARRIRARPVLLVTTAREEELADALTLQRVLDELAREPDAVAITLSPLSRAETTALVGRLARAGADPTALERLVEQVWNVSDGNPFMVVETMRALDEGSLAEGAPGLVLPERVRRIVARRLERLGERGQRLVAAAAVIGRDFEFPLLWRAAGLDEREAAEGVEELVRRRLLQVVGERFDFTHDRIREVAYAQLLVPHRRLLHGAVARALEEVYAESLAGHDAALGHHYYENEAWEPAFVYLQQAGRAAAKRSAHREAVVAFDQTLAVFDRLPPNRERTEQAIDVQLALRQSLFTRGDIGRVLDCLRSAERLARSLGDEVRLGWASSFLTHCLSILGQHDSAVETGARALAVADAKGLFALRVATSFYLGATHYYLGNFTRGRDLLRLNVTALAGDLGSEAFGLAFYSPSSVPSQTYLALCLAELGEFEEGLTCAREALQLADRVDNPWDIFHGCLGLGRVFGRQGAFDRAIPILRRGLAVCEARDLPLGSAVLAPLLGFSLAQLGAFDEALALLEPVSTTPIVPHFLIFAGESHLLAGRFEEAAQLARRALELCAGRRERGFEAWATWLCGEIAVRRHPLETAGAESDYRSALALSRELSMRPLAAHCHLGLGELHRHIGKLIEARAELTAATALYREMAMTHWLTRAEGQLASVA